MNVEVICDGAPPDADPPLGPGQRCFQYLVEHLTTGIGRE